MIIRSFKSTWGMTERSIADKLARIAADGYAGVEIVLPRDNVELNALRTAAVANNLFVMPQLQLEEPAEIGPALARAARLNPSSVVLQGGRDRMTRDEGRRFVEAGLAAQTATGIRVLHETHRSRLFFTPWITADYLREFPEAWICADFSHWVCVTERLLDDCEHEMAVAINRTGHIHARVGYEQGPQVSDPRAPEWAGHLAKHLTWWRAVASASRARGEPVLSFDPEYGPAPYLPALPYTCQPVADLSEICLAMSACVGVYLSEDADSVF